MVRTAFIERWDHADYMWYLMGALLRAIDHERIGSAVECGNGRGDRACDSGGSGGRGCGIVS